MYLDWVCQWVWPTFDNYASMKILYIVAWMKHDAKNTCEMLSRVASENIGKFCC